MSPSERPVDIETSVQPPSKEIILKPFQEVRGRLQAFRLDARFVYIEFSSGTLRFELDSPEASICRGKLEGNVGQLVSILRTDDPSNRVAVFVEESISGGPIDESRFELRHRSQDAPD